MLILTGEEAWFRNARLIRGTGRRVGRRVPQYVTVNRSLRTLYNRLTIAHDLTVDQYLEGVQYNLATFARLEEVPNAQAPAGGMAVAAGGAGNAQVAAGGPMDDEEEANEGEIIDYGEDYDEDDEEYEEYEEEGEGEDEDEAEDEDVDEQEGDFDLPDLESQDDDLDLPDLDSQDEVEDMDQD